MASSILTSTAKELGGLVVEEAKYLYGVSHKIERLQRDLRWMNCFLEDADNRQHREKVVAMWVAEIKDFAYEAQEIVEKYVHKVSHPRQEGVWNTIKWSLCVLYDAQAFHEVGSNIDDLRIRIAELIARLQLYGVKVTKEDEASTYNVSTRERRLTYSHIQEDPVGLDKDTRKVVEHLVVNEHVKFVCICGMGGLGKTTLARQVFQDITTREHFKNNLAWVCTSKQFEKREVFREILMGLTNVKGVEARMEISTLTDGELPRKICEILREKECLVVLDDIWTSNDWNVLRPALDSIKTSGSKILITTRNNGLMQHVDLPMYFHNPNLLNDEDSWKLFQRIVFSESTIEDGDMKAREELGREMLKHCKGLPLAILTLGGILCNKKTIPEWKIVQKNITSYLMGDLKQESESKGLFAILELSYMDLPFYLKPCFMYLGNFPEDYDISAERLYHLWEAEGLVTFSSDDEDENQEACLDDVAELYLRKLVERCLVQVSKCYVNGRIKSCRLHDVMRDMCLKQCNEVNFLKIIRSEEASKQIVSSSSSNRKMHRCALYLKETNSVGYTPIDPSANVAPSIRSLLVFQPGRDCWQKKLFTTNMSRFLSLLRVLDLQRIRIPMHSKVIKEFIHLRYLCFRHATMFASSPPYFWDCKYLETLDLRWDSDGEFLISNKFWKLERLRHLYLPFSMKLRGSSRLILTDNQLQRLETLKNLHLELFQMEDLEKMTSLRAFTFARFRYLSKNEVKHLLNAHVIATKRLVNPLRLPLKAEVISEEEAQVLAELQSHVCISGLRINGRIKDPINIELFHEQLTKLWLLESEITQEGISMLEKLPNLRKLTFLNKAIVGNKMSFSNRGFPQLNRLVLTDLSDLEEWEVKEGALPNLQSLSIIHCGKLKMIPDCLPIPVYVSCINPCVSGVEKYNTCPHYAKAVGNENLPGSSTPRGIHFLSTCFS